MADRVQGTLGAAKVLRCCPSAGGGDETSEIIIQTNFMLNLTVGRDGGSETPCSVRAGEQTTIVEVSCQQAAIAITTTTTTGGGAGAATQRQHVHCAFCQLAGQAGERARGSSTLGLGQF